MKNSFLLLAFVPGALLTSVQAATEAGYQPATVVSVESHATPSTSDGGDLPHSQKPASPRGVAREIGLVPRPLFGRHKNQDSRRGSSRG
jgi:hypothetical protein